MPPVRLASPPQRHPLPIVDVARRIGLTEEDLEPHGRFTAKVHLGVRERLADRPTGHYVAVTAITPTPLGGAKTVTTIGLAQGLWRTGRPAVACLRQPSLAPTFGLKGGGAGAWRRRDGAVRRGRAPMADGPGRGMLATGRADETDMPEVDPLLEEAISAVVATTILGVAIAVIFWLISGTSPWPGVILGEIAGLGFGVALLALASPRRHR